MNIALNITLDDEQTDALNGVVAAVNAARASNNPPLPAITADQHVSGLVRQAVNAYVKTAYGNAVKRLGEGAAQLDYASRQALIAQVQAQLGG